MKTITLILPILIGYLLSTVPCHAYRDLETGVFLSRDPAGQVDGPNVYTYVRQNPWSGFDPLGLYTGFEAATQHMTAKQEVEVFKQTAKVAVPLIAGTAATVLTAGAAAPLVAEIGMGVTASVLTTGAISGAVGGAATQMTSNVIEGKSVTHDAPQAMAIGAALGVAGEAAGLGIAGFKASFLKAAGMGENSTARLTQAKSAVEAANRGGRLGNQSTRAHIDEVGTEMEKRGWEITGGGGRLPEEYLAGPGGARKGSSFPDITATKDGRTLRVNTVDTRANGVTPSTRESTNAARIRSQVPEDHLLLVPKPKKP